METIKETIQELTQHFNARMADFQQNLTSSIPATSPTSNILAQFSSFRTFVLSALEGLQLQVLLLSKQQDNFEMRSRRKMLLVHGVLEEKKENVSQQTIKFLANHLKMTDLSVNDISHCHRFGSTVLKKPRAIVVKFKDLTLKNKVWYSKTNLKNTGVTLSEFLTKSRHDTFMAARQCFGISKCWTKNGFIIVIGSDGQHHSISSNAELSNIPSTPESQLAASSAPPGKTSQPKAKTSITVRAKRTLKNPKQVINVKLEELHTLPGPEGVAENASEECLARNSNLSEIYCQPYFDGLLCWDATPWNTLAVQKCFSEFHGVQYDDTQNASRLCLEGEWHNYTNYANCTERIANVSPTDITSLIYLAGYTLSLAVLSLAVFVFLYFKDLRCLRNTIHTNLMSTYILSACSWMLNLALQNWSDDAQHEQTSCMILVICMHYFYLTNFFWMLVEGLYLYMLVVETFTAENIKLKVYTTIGWGAPAIFIIIWVISRSFVSVVPSTGPDGLTITGDTKMCQWIHEHQVDWIHKAPALAGLALNLFFLIRIMWVLITKLRSANTLETEQYRKATKALLVLIPLLGITNLLVLCGPSDDSWFAYTFDYTRAVMLSTQGFTVALFYCFMNTEVRHAIRYHVERWKNGRNIGGGRRRGASYSKDWSPRSRTESIRLYSHPSKRESAASETTTTTLLVPRMSLAPHHDGRHLHADYITSGSASGDQSPV